MYGMNPVLRRHSVLEMDNNFFHIYVFQSIRKVFIEIHSLCPTVLNAPFKIRIDQQSLLG